jgi:hypothetical protein
MKEVCTLEVRRRPAPSREDPFRCPNDCQSHDRSRGGASLAPHGCDATTNDDHGHHPSVPGDDDASTTTNGDYGDDRRHP